MSDATRLPLSTKWIAVIVRMRMIYSMRSKPTVLHQLLPKTETANMTAQTQKWRMNSTV